MVFAVKQQARFRKQREAVQLAVIAVHAVALYGIAALDAKALLVAEKLVDRPYQAASGEHGNHNAADPENIRQRFVQRVIDNGAHVFAPVAAVNQAYMNGMLLFKIPKRVLQERIQHGLFQGEGNFPLRRLFLEEHLLGRRGHCAVRLRRLAETGRSRRRFFFPFGDKGSDRAVSNQQAFFDQAVHRLAQGRAADVVLFAQCHLAGNLAPGRPLPAEDGVSEDGPKLYIDRYADLFVKRQARFFLSCVSQPYLFYSIITGKNAQFILSIITGKNVPFILLRPRR